MSIKQECINVITELCDVAKLKKGDILVVGLGNIYVTPDSLRTKSSK